MRTAVLGGGPGGSFAATLIKSADPTREVVVFERNQAEDTSGSGVVFSEATLEGIHSTDPVLRTALDQHGVHPTSGRLVPVTDNAVHLSGGPLLLRGQPVEGGAPWALRVTAAEAEADLAERARRRREGHCARRRARRCDRWHTTRWRLICEAARLEHGAGALLVDHHVDPARNDDVALTAVLSGRCDLVASPVAQP